MTMNERTKRSEPHKHSDVALASWLGLAFHLGGLFGVLLCWIAWRLP